MRARRSPGVGAIVLLLAAVALLLWRGPQEESREDGGDPAAGGVAAAEVVRVVDGDTIEVALNGAPERVRYIGVDAPESVAPGEPVECFGRRAASFNERLVAGRRVELRFDRERRDRYGRLLAYVRTAGRDVNAELVRRGLARTLTIPPNDARAKQLARLEREAASAGRGLWGEC